MTIAADRKERILADAKVRILNGEYRTRNCVKCGVEFNRKDCPVCAKARNAAWCKANAEKLKLDRAEYYIAHKDVMSQQTARYCKDNAAKLKAYHAQWVKDNPASINAVTAKRRAARIQATPKWASDSAMKEMYRDAAAISRATGVKWHVDHIVPLTSEFVCGLHCEFNMQLLTDRENCLKSNKSWPDMP